MWCGARTTVGPRMEFSGGTGLNPRSVARISTADEELQRLVNELAGLIDSPTDPAEGLETWGASLRRRHAIAAAMRSLAQAHRLQGSPDDAARIYEIALDIGPRIHEYDNAELQGRPAVPLDIALDLGSLLNTQPQLDREQVRFRSLEEELLEEKNLHYARGDLPMIQRFHTVLGLMYADRGRWEAGWRAAPYHLGRAVKTAQQIARRDAREYQPLPHLTRTYAEGLRRTGNADDAVNLDLDAATGYLDLNMLGEVDSTLDSATDLSGGAPESTMKRLKELENVLEIRREIRQLPPERLRGSQRGEIRDPESAWKRAGDQTVLHPRFVNRQRFRAETELGLKYWWAGDRENGLRLQREALTWIRSHPGATAADFRGVLEGPVFGLDLDRLEAWGIGQAEVRDETILTPEALRGVDWSKLNRRDRDGPGRGGNGSR